jgi:hypothetical protein
LELDVSEKINKISQINGDYNIDDDYDDFDDDVDLMSVPMNSEAFLARIAK